MTCIVECGGCGALRGPGGEHTCSEADIRAHAAACGEVAPAAVEATQRFLCREHGLGVAASEDGCCVTCGADCAIVSVIVPFPEREEDDRSDAGEDALASARARILELEGLLNSPETESFTRAVLLEAAHQRQRWEPFDRHKRPWDWAGTVMILAGKALHGRSTDMFANEAEQKAKRRHRIVSAAAAAANWFLAEGGTL